MAWGHLIRDSGKGKMSVPLTDSPGSINGFLCRCFTVPPLTWECSRTGPREQDGGDSTNRGFHLEGVCHTPTLVRGQETPGGKDRSRRTPGVLRRFRCSRGAVRGPEDATGPTKSRNPVDTRRVRTTVLRNPMGEVRCTLDTRSEHQPSSLSTD